MDELTITISNLEASEATEILNAVSKTINELEIGRSGPCSDSRAEIQMRFSFNAPKPSTVCRGEESTFSRYISGTKRSDI